ncbi:MAG: flagellar biosynthesis anti-sigma factor FlgM [Candidatus Krumholzibacteria bacterium]|jgi:hypothetical protein|nr:flagellar biosynthesis anti-sigma factor FlgM [Candidatus Krumholzibacteria bacterium]
MALNKINPAVTSKTYQTDRYEKTSQPVNADPAGGKDVGTHRPPLSVSDHAEISSQAQQFADVRQVLEMARQEVAKEPDVRAGKVAQARERLAAGFYQSTEVRDQVAERLSRLFLEPDLF